MVADHIDDGREGAARIVQVGDPVAVTGAQMQQGAGGLAGHAAVAVGGPGGHAFELAEDRAHGRDAVQRRHELHLAGARVRETGGHVVGDQGREQGVGAVHQNTITSEEGGSANSSAMAVARRCRASAWAI
jgi:hypothetical protein